MRPRAHLKLLLGLLYSDKSPAGLAAGDLPTPAGVVCLLLALVGCGIIIQGVSTYSIALGYIQNKNDVLNVAFQKLLGLDEPPMKAVATWESGLARATIQFASSLLFILHKALTVALLVIAAYSLPYRWFVAGVIFTWCFLAATVAAELTLIRAMDRVLLNATLGSARP